MPRFVEIAALLGDQRFRREMAQEPKPVMRLLVRIMRRSPPVALMGGLDAHFVDPGADMRMADQ